MTTADDAGELCGAHALERAAATFAEGRLTFPRVPAHVVPYLRSDDSVFLATDGAPWDAMAGYDLELGRNDLEHVPGDYLHDGGPDYFVCGGRDSGYGTSWGFVARAGGLFVTIQIQIGSVLTDPVDEANRVFGAFDRHLAPLMDRGTRPLVAAALYSTFRHHADVLSRDPARWPASPDDLPEGWGYERRLDPDSDSPEPTSDDSDLAPEVQAALAFLDEVQAPFAGTLPEDD